MSVQSAGAPELFEAWQGFFEQYYREEIGELIEQYPEESKSLVIREGDLFRYDRDLAENLEAHPEQVLEIANEALAEYDLPVDVNLSDAKVRVTDLPEHKVKEISELRSEDVNAYRAIHGRVERVTDSKSKMTVAAFECQRCGTFTRVPQTMDSFQEPHECQGCERQGPFQTNHSQSEFVDECRVQLKQPPGNNGTDGQTMEVHLEDDLVDIGGENGIYDHAGEQATFYGIVRLEQLGSGNKKKPIFDYYLEGHAVQIEGKIEDEVDIEEHRDEFEAHASADDAYDRFAESIAPQIHPTKKWQLIFDLATAYLFGAPRIDPPDGPTYRGDIHIGIFGDPGMAKSVVMGEIDQISPGSEYRSATGLSSDVGLTAAAVRDDFGHGDQWTLKAGVLARPKHHALIDEIDKGPDELTSINDALEGDQQIKIDKAGIRADLNTRVGLFVSGNPQNGRFNQHDPIAEQIGIDPTLFSRFDGVVTLIDEPDQEQDQNVGKHILDSYEEAAEMIRADDPSDVERDRTERRVDKDVLKAWVMAARNELGDPEFADGVKDRLLEFYTDTRQSNKKIGDEMEGRSPVPITARSLEAGVRISVAFARLRLSNRVSVEDAERAIDVSKRVFAETFDPETGTFNVDAHTEAQTGNQEERIERIEKLVGDSEDDYDEGVPVEVVKERAEEEFGIAPSKVEHEVEKLKQQGEMYEPRTDHVRTT